MGDHTLKREIKDFNKEKQGFYADHAIQKCKARNCGEEEKGFVKTDPLLQPRNKKKTLFFSRRQRQDFFLKPRINAAHALANIAVNAFPSFMTTSLLLGRANKINPFFISDGREKERTNLSSFDVPRCL